MPPKPDDLPRFLLPGEFILGHSCYSAGFLLFYLNLRENTKVQA